MEMDPKDRKWESENPKRRSFLVVDGMYFFARRTVAEFSWLFAGNNGSCGTDFESLEMYGKDVGGEILTGSILGKGGVGIVLRHTSG